MRSYQHFILSILFLNATFLLTSCFTDDYTPDFEVPVSNYSVYPQRDSSSTKETISLSLDKDHPAIKKMQDRARRIARISWTPKGPIPSNSGSFLPNKTYLGIPYSSVKELNKFVGQDVSFHTFLAAVNNPRSVLYTENVSLSPYKGTNCSTYYGTVCSMTINYALGLNRPFSTQVYDTLSSFKKLANQSFSALAPGDVVWRNSHVVLVTDVIRNEKGDVERLEVLESNGMGTSLINYSLNDFVERWKGINWVLYRYVGLAGLDDYYDSFLWNESLLSEVNDDLSLNRGNWVSYREGEEVIVNVLSSRFSTIELIKGGELLLQEPVVGTTDLIFSSLEPGYYQIQLTNEEESSKAIDFEVIDTRVSVTKTQKWLKISFDSVNADPEFILFCDEKGAPYFITDLTDVDKSRKYAYVKCEKSIKNLYLKVFFMGEFGRVSNEIIPLW